MVTSMSLLIHSAPAATLLGTVLASVPAMRAALLLKNKTPEPTAEQKNSDSQFERLQRKANRKLEEIAQNWPPSLLWMFAIGLALMVYGALIDALVSYNYIK
jgi:hypothetical protein